MTLNGRGDGLADIRRPGVSPHLAVALDVDGDALLPGEWVDRAQLTTLVDRSRHARDDWLLPHPGNARLRSGNA
jgi:hypothetical protein